MIQTLSQTLNADKFIEQYGDQDRYELIDGEVVYCGGG